MKNIYSHHEDIAGYAVLCVLLITGLIPLSLSFAPQVLGLLGIAYLVSQRALTMPLKYPAALEILLTISGLALISTFWSVTPSDSFCRGLKIGGLIISYIPLMVFLSHLPSRSAEIIKTHFAIPLILIAAAIANEFTFDFPISHYLFGDKLQFSRWQANKHISELLLLTPFALGFALNKKKFFQAGLLVMLLLPILWDTDSQAAQVAIAGVLFALAGYRLLPKLALQICFTTCSLLLIFMPWLSIFIYNNFADKTAGNAFLKAASANARFEVWYFVSNKILERPFTGFGVDTTRAIQFDGPMVYFKNTSVLHPHNIALQLWIEFGTFGPMLGCLVLWNVYRFLNGVSEKQKMMLLSVFVASTTFLLISWSIWSSWLIGLIMLLVSFATARSLAIEPNQQPEARYGLFPALKFR